MRYPVPRRLLLVLGIAFALLLVLQTTTSPSPTPRPVKVGCRALEEIQAEGGITLPKGTEFRYEPSPLNDGTGFLTLTLIVDDERTYRSKFAQIEDPSLMYHVAK
jgi:hypothetical protein